MQPPPRSRGKGSQPRWALGKFESRDHDMVGMEQALADWEEGNISPENGVLVGWYRVGLPW
jgi:hypothetical protein